MLSLCHWPQDIPFPEYFIPQQADFVRHRPENIQTIFRLGHGGVFIADHQGFDIVTIHIQHDQASLMTSFMVMLVFTPEEISL
jgi:hypothetical protein